MDPFNGNLSLQFVDLFIPGNGGFDLRVQRSYNVNAIDDLSSPFGRGWDMHFGRVSHLAAETCSTASPQSMSLELPDGSKQTLHKSNGAGSTSTSDYLTTSFWKGRCNGVAGITIFSPEGTQYDMSEVDGPYWHVRRITDRHGNYFDLTYVSSGASGRKVVSRVSANDGRLVAYSYSGGQVTAISGAGRTWIYNVVAGPDGSNQLATVTPPAGGAWQFSYAGNLGSAAGSYALQRITNPFGGALTYSYQFVSFMPGTLPASTVVSRKTSGTDTWLYTYSPGCASSGSDTTKAFLPNNDAIVYSHFGYCGVASGEVWKIGLLQQKTVGSLHTETYSWTPQSISAETNVRPAYTKSDPQIRRALLAQRTITRDGASYTTTYSSFDAYGNASSVTESGPAGVRSRTFTYFNSPTSWILGRVESEFIQGAGTISSPRNSEGDPNSESRFGVTTSFSYDATGSVSQKRTDKPVTTTYFSYWRGIPRTESRPEGVTITRQVDDAGNVTSESDGEFNWTYGYDGIGRLTSIGFPSGADATVGWTANSRSLTRGAFNETTAFDAFGRVTSVNREGVTVTSRYDASGRKAFESLPGSASGNTYTYDALGRVKTVASPAGTRTYAYSAGSVTIANERGYSTRYDYDRYGDPDEGYLVQIGAPLAAASVVMSRNPIGILLSATQNGVTRTYGRDPSFFLTSINEPESGTTTFGRDGVGNMTSKTSGGQTMTYGYDGLNRLTSFSGPGISATLAYDRRGKVKSVSNGAGSRTYAYDNNGNLIEDRLSIDGQLFVVGYGYDTIDGLSSVTYPMSKGTVTHAPNGLGRPTQAAPYVTSIAHHPSGNLSTMQYANGVSQTFGENSRQLPSSIASSFGLALSYNYDPAGNVDLITDSQVASESRNFDYDGIDRLTTANGPWGAGRVDYNGSGNITRQQFGTYAIDYTYSQNRLVSLTGSRTRTYSYDSRGNTASNGESTFTFDAVSQVSCANCGTPSEIQYQYDGQGRRLSEQKNGRKTYFVQAPHGDLQFEYSPNGKLWTKHAYVHGKRVATETGSDALVTTTSASATPASVTFGESVTLQAMVSPPAATGTVEFRDGIQTLGAATLSGGQATLSLGTLTVGTRSVTVSYLGDANYQSSGTTTTVTVGKRTAAVTLAASPTMPALGQAVALTATVTGTNPTGQVEFREGSQLLGTASVSASGTAGVAAGPFAAGNHTFNAMYLGDANHSGNSSTASVQVSKATPSVSITSSIPSSTWGQSVTVIASLTAVAGIGTTGTVTFWDGTTAVGTAAVSGGSASITSSTLTVGSHSLTATYSGDSNYNGATSAAYTQQVAAGQDTLSITQSPSANPADTGKDVIFTMVARNSGTDPVSGVAVSSSYDSSAAVVWVSPGCVNQGGAAAYVCNVGTLGAGASVQFKLVLRKGVAAAMYNTASVSGSPDGNPDNNSTTLTVGVNPSVPGTPVWRYRLYSSVTQEHMYTLDVNEYNVLAQNGWVQEGTVGKLLDNPGSFNGVAAMPYYRLYNDTTKLHHWTSDANEYYTLSEWPGWRAEGPSGYILPGYTPGATALYRLSYPDGRGLHHWTIDANEYNVLISSYGWVGEGVAGYVIQ